VTTIRIAVYKNGGFMSKRALIIYNPVSNIEPTLGKLTRGLCEADDYVVGLFATKPSTTLSDLLPLIERKPDLVVVAGGDGTIRFTLAALAFAKADIPVAIIPIGTLNVLARNLGILDNAFFPKSISNDLNSVLHGKSMRMDLGLMNGRYFAVAVGVGPMADAFVVPSRIEKKRIRLVAYLTSMTRALFQAPRRFRITTESTVLDVVASGIFLTNVENLGLRRQANVGDLCDGYLDLHIFSPKNFGDWLRLGSHYLMGNAQCTIPGRVLKVKQADIEILAKVGKKLKHGKESMVMIDGEIAGVTPMSVKVAPKSVDVLVPYATVEVTENVHEVPAQSQAMIP